MFRTIVIGYGNIDRADDGVAYHVVNDLRQRLGLSILDENTAGLEDLGSKIDSIFLRQLAPEIMPLLTDYNLIIFVDAHTLDNQDLFYCVPVVPRYTTSILTHQMSPSAFLAFLKTIYNHEAEGYIVSIRGKDYDFHRTISLETRSFIEKAVNYILELDKKYRNKKMEV